MSFKSRLIAGVATSLLLGGVTVAQAQDASEEAVATEESNGDSDFKRMDTVTVSSERRDASILDTPVAVTAVSSEQRDLLGILDQTDLANYTPGMTYQQSPNRITIRGIGRLTNAQGTDPGVATYVDGIYTSEAAEIARSPLFVERVEVLRGPQGTLFGRNSIGGLVNIISKKPEFETNGEIRLRYGSFDTISAAGTFTAPFPGMEDTTAFRINGTFSVAGEGRERNVADTGPDFFGAEDQNRFDFLLSHEFSDRLNFFFRYNTSRYMHTPGAARRVEPYDYTGDVRNPQTIGYYGTIAPNTYYGLTDENPAVDNPHEVALDYQGVTKLTDNHAFTWELDYEADNMTIKYLGSHQNYDWEQYTDADGTARASHTLSPADPTVSGVTDTSTFFVNYIEDTKRWESHELQFLSNGDGPLSWIGGLFYYKERARQPYDLRAPEAPAAGIAPNVLSPTAFASDPIFCPIPNGSGGFIPALYCGVIPAGAAGEYNGSNNYYHQLGLLHMKSTAVYGQIDYEFAPQWNFKLGGRYTMDEKRGYEEQSVHYYDPTGGVASLGLAAPVPYQWFQVSENDNNRIIKNDWDAFSGVVGLSYEPTEDSLIYSQYTRGYKAGGFRLGQLAPDDPTTPNIDERFVEPEFVDAYEIGAKGMLFDHRLQLAASAFIYQYEDQQVPVNYLNPNTGIQQQIFYNVPESESKGFELEAAYQPTETFRFGLNYGYLDSTVESFPGAIENTYLGTNESVEGNTLPRSPEHSLNLNATYIHELANGSDLTFTGSWTHVGEQHTSLFEDDIYTTDAHELANLRAIWTNDGGDLRIIAAVNNITDEDIEVSAGPAGSTAGFARSEAGNRQRTFFVELQKKF